MRRLSRREYANTIQDLLGVEPDVSLLPEDGNAGVFYSVGIKSGAHGLSHVAGPDYPNAAEIEACRARNLAHAELLAHLFDRLKAVKEADGSTHSWPERSRATLAG